MPESSMAWRMVMVIFDIDDVPAHDAASAHARQRPRLFPIGHRNERVSISCIAVKRLQQPARSLQGVLTASPV